MNWYTAEAVSSADSTRIEVLRGPQGTLYGRNAEIGAINLYTNDPTDKYQGKVIVGGGSYNLVNSEAMVNVPLDDEMAFRVVDRCMQVHGGIALTTDLPIERMWRQQRSYRITEGATEVMKMIIARHVLKAYP